jgi:hypothetical protein
MRSPTARSDPGRERPLARWLFPAPEAPSLRGARRSVLLAGIGVISFAAILFRIPPSSWNTPWAEDAWVFLADALDDGIAAVPTPFAGYLHLVPRLVALAAGAAPLDIAPLVLALLTAALTAALTVALYVFAEQLIASPLIRAAVVVSFALLPLATAEAALSIANLHWYLMVVAFWALIAPARGRGSLLLAGVIVVAAVTSDPLTVLFAPLLLLRLLARAPGARGLTLAAVTGAAVQGAAVLVARLSDEPRQFAQSRPALGDLAEAAAGHVALPALGGVRISEWLLAHLGPLAAVLAAVVVLALLAAGVVLVPRRAVVAAFATGAALFFAVVCVLQWDALGPFPAALNHGARYMMLPILLTLGGIAIAVDGLATRISRPAGVTLAALFLVGVAASGVLDFRGWDFRAGVPSWPDALEQAEEDDCRVPTDTARPVIAPEWFQRPEISCALLLD